MFILCTICSEDVKHSENVLVTNCGHLYHHQCLSDWLLRSNTCPHCRSMVTEECMFRVFPESPEGGGGGGGGGGGDEAAWVDELLQQQQETNDKLKEVTIALKKTKKLLKTSQENLRSRDSYVSALTARLAQERRGARLLREQMLQLINKERPCGRSRSAPPSLSGVGCAPAPAPATSSAPAPEDAVQANDEP